jgi:putative permease
MEQLLAEFRLELASVGQNVLSASVSSIPSIIAVVIYLVLVPLLVYFFLMDRYRITRWLKHYLPTQRRLISQVWSEVYAQIGNYVRGKVLEMIIVWIVCYMAFVLLGLQYAMLLSALVGLSVIIPYIGAVVVTVPVLVIGFLQWGWGTHFISLLITYSVIIALDANILVPLLFSEAVDLHPVAIIIAILVFGGLLGFWGVFFAIPLATLVKAILHAVSTRQHEHAKRR